MTEVHGSPIQAPGQPPAAPSITLNIPFPVRSQDGQTIDRVYVIQEVSASSRVSLADADSGLKQ